MLTFDENTIKKEIEKNEDFNKLYIECEKSLLENAKEFNLVSETILHLNKNDTILLKALKEIRNNSKRKMNLSAQRIEEIVLEQYNKLVGDCNEKD